MSQLVSTRPRTRMFTRQQEELNIKRRKEAADDIIFYEDFDGRMQIISMKQMEEVTKALDGRTKITRPRIRMLTRQQEQKGKRRKEAADDIIFYEDFDGRMQIISMKQMEEVTKALDGRTKITRPRIRMLTRQQEQKSKRRKVTADDIILYEDLNGRAQIISMKQVEEGRTKIITTNKQKEEDNIFYEDLDGSTKINEEQNSKMNNTTKKDHNKALDGRPELITHPVDSRESEVDWRELRRESLGGTAWERALRRESLGETAWERELGRESLGEREYYNITMHILYGDQIRIY